MSGQGKKLSLRAVARIVSLGGLVLMAAGSGGHAGPAPAAGLIEANVALGCSFTTSGPAHGDWNGLTDGIKDSDIAPGCYATDNDGHLPKWVLLDLGRVYNVT